MCRTTLVLVRRVVGVLYTRDFFLDLCLHLQLDLYQVIRSLLDTDARSSVVRSCNDAPPDGLLWSTPGSSDESSAVTNSAVLLDTLLLCQSLGGLEEIVVLTFMVYEQKVKALSF